jgi:hypothetical protein
MRLALTTALALAASGSFLHAQAQEVTTSDRVFSGSNNISAVAKIGPTMVRNVALGRLLQNGRATVFIIHQVPSLVSETGVNQRYVLYYAIGQRTRLEELMISKEDYDALIRIADQINIQ